MEEQTKKFSLITIIALIVLALIVGGGLYLWSNAKFSDLSKQISELKNNVNDQVEVKDTAPSKVDDKLNVKTDSEKATMATYKNDELGLSFEYPVEYGEVKFDKVNYDKSGFSGDKFQLTFSANKNVVFTGVSKDYQVGTSDFLIYVNQGYVKKNSDYYVLTVYSELNYQNPKLFEITPSEVLVNDSGVEVVVVDETFRPRTSDLTKYEEPLKNQLGAFVNLKGDDFKGFGVIDKNLSDVSETEFMAILKSIKIN